MVTLLAVAPSAVVTAMVMSTPSPVVARVRAEVLTVCAVITVASTAASVAASGVGLAADAAIGTVRLTGRAVGAAATVVLPSDESR